jgi:hypothetical protein
MTEEFNLSDNYNTPKWIMDLFENWFDPCPLNPNPQIDGLNIEWRDKTYVNPPYSSPLLWVIKAIEENKKGKQIALLLKLDCSTKWFLMLQNANAHIMLINERVRFNGKAPPFCNALFILDKLVGDKLVEAEK